MGWTPGDVSGSETLTSEDHIYESHINELRESGPAVVVGRTANCQYYCDGTADDVQIQQALTAAAGKRVIILPGVYDITATLLFDTNTVVEGCGMATQLKAGTNLNAPVLKSNGRINSSRVRNLYINGNSANQSVSGTGIEVDGYYNHFENVWAVDCKTYGIYLSATSASSENIIDGGRYNGGTRGIFINTGNADTVVRDVSAYAGAVAVYNRGGATRFQNLITWDSTSYCFYTDVQCELHNFRAGTTPVGIYVDGSSQNIFGIWAGFVASNLSFSGVTDHCVYVNAGSAKTAAFNIIGWYGTSTNAELSLDGAGTHKFKIISNYTDLDCELLSGSIHNESVIKQPEWPRTTAPANPVKGMIYLDSGANTASTGMGYRRHSGSAWADLTG